MSGTTENIERMTAEILRGLKDFQRATVERVDRLFHSGHHRVLVADEVGLGKTMTARGIIARMAQRRHDEGKECFTVIYVCSNQSIANQNISDLDVFHSGHDDIMSARLSMQHLRICQSRQKDVGKFIRLVPLTPQTSFNQRSRQGTANERALIYCILRRMTHFADKNIRRRLRRLMRHGVSKKSWKFLIEKFDEQIDRLAEATGGSYPAEIHRAIEADNSTFATLIGQLANGNSTTDDGNLSDLQLINDLRRLFARISVRQLRPDLVIMDEFQNFQFLLNSDDEEIKTLTDCFFGVGRTTDPTRILLLSATPYNPYVAKGNVGDNNAGDTHHREFMAVMRFLFAEQGRFERFSRVWDDYSAALANPRNDEAWLRNLEEKVRAAESELYDAVCRTERLSVMESGDYTDDSSRMLPLEISQADIRTYLQAAALMDCAGRRFNIEYIKSCPWPLSFMTDYVERKVYLPAYFAAHPEDLTKKNKNLLWIDKSLIRTYKPLPAVNARFEQLKRLAFTNHTELLLWMPPSRPIYKPFGVFAGHERFSKTLIFSSWTMVPRMIGSLLSYEAERMTIGRLASSAGRRVSYFKTSDDNGEKGSTRYPYSRLKWSDMATLALVYPSATLASSLSPRDMPADTLPDIRSVESVVRKRIRPILKRITAPFHTKRRKSKSSRDKRWYILAPMLMDPPEIVDQWLDSLAKRDGGKTLAETAGRLREIYESWCETLGAPPADLEDVLVSLAIASPAVALLRTLGHAPTAAQVAEDFVRYFNSPESTAIVRLAVSRQNRNSSDFHWLDVLTYCKAGNIQAMLDEFVHLLRRGRPLAEPRVLEEIKRRFHECLTLHSSPYRVESFEEFVSTINNDSPTRHIRLRTHFATGFSKEEETDKAVARKDNLRDAFNSPFWPFVLASTSIGQEGLDFHLYCRRIMHWNLPTSPVDLEQREGRINRFKCLAIRQNVAEKYGHIVTDSESDIWDDLFSAAEAERKPGQSELIPYWCFGENQDIKIERLLPLYPVSRDTERYADLIRKLSLYRLTLGQPRQEELLEHIFRNIPDPTRLKTLFINLSPISRH